MDEIRVLYRLVITVMCFVCLGLSVGMCSESDALIKTYVSSSLHSDDLLSSTKLQIPYVAESDWDSLVMESKVPVMVMFTAEWCGPCRAMSPMLDQLNSEFAGRFKFYRVDIDLEREIAPRWDIRALPTIVVFKGGYLVATRAGALEVTTLREIIEKYM
ncbi:unnamed protein product [Brassica rapa subsp. narinosa]